MPVCVHCKKEVELIKEDDDLLCSECGWVQDEESKSGNNRSSQRSDGSSTTKKKPLAGKVIGILLIVVGVISLRSFIGIIDIILGIGVFRNKEKFRDWAVLFSVIQLVIIIAGLIFFLVMASQYEALMEMDFFTNFIFAVPILLVEKVIVWVTLTRKSVKVTFK